MGAIKQSRRHIIENSSFYWFGFVLLLGVGLASATYGQVSQESAAPTRKVTLRWKLNPGEDFKGKIAFGIRTFNNNPKHTSFVYEYRWHVESLKDDGRAVVKLIVDRARFQHRSENAKVDYDSNNDASIEFTETERGEIQAFLDLARKMREREFRFLCSGQGNIWKAEDYEFFPSQMAVWPQLPEQPVGEGDSWTIVSNDGKAEEYELVNLEEIDGQSVALIERKSDTMRCRFLVEAGRFLDDVYWNITRFKSRKNGSFLQSVSQRRRLQPTTGQIEFDRWKMLQANQPGRAMNLIQGSFSKTGEIKEDLLNERGLLSRIQNGLFIEHVDRIDFPEPSPKWEPIDWLMSARYYERSGQVAKYRQLLKEAVDAFSAMPNKAGMHRNVFLLQLADLLVDIGEFETAKMACLEIDPQAMSGLNVTASGDYLRVPSSSLRHYGLFLVAREQAKAAMADESIKTAELIAERSARSAAHWVVAMHLADHEKTEHALRNVALAEERYSADAKFFEFETIGPVEIAVQAYRTLALGRVAVCQAKQGDEAAMRETVKMIDDPVERNAVKVDLIVALEQEGMTSMADKISEELPDLMRSTEIGYRIALRLQAEDFESIPPMIEAISDPTWKAASCMNYCLYLRTGSDHAAKLQKHLGLVQTSIEQISVPQNRAAALVDFATVFLKLGKPEQAKNQFVDGSRSG